MLQAIGQCSWAKLATLLCHGVGEDDVAPAIKANAQHAKATANGGADSGKAMPRSAGAKSNNTSSNEDQTRVAHLIDSEPLMGQDKWLGGVLGKTLDAEATVGAKREVLHRVDVLPIIRVRVRVRARVRTFIHMV